MNGRGSDRRARASVHDALARAALLALCGAMAQAARAAEAPASAASAAQTVVVTATRIATPPFDVAGAVDRVDAGAADADRPGVNLSEVLAGVPGLQARDRQNYAQDLQLSLIHI